tara:strand:+ start:1266 stop:1523 length:258 start_codon:yes stop_codon:yes gene_type:complete
MALKKTATTKHGFEATDAYHRVEGVRLETKTKITFQLRLYKSQSSEVAFADEFFSCDYDLMGENPIKQAYQYLRTLPEFTGAFDC